MIYVEAAGTDKTDTSATEITESTYGNREYEVGFSVSSAARGTGLAQAALSALIEGVVVGLLNGTSVIADVKEDNIASRKTLQRCGFDEVRAYRPEELPPHFEKYTILLYRKRLSASPAPPRKVNLPSPSPRLSKVLWDSETKEPFIEVREGVRLTPVRRSDVDAWYELYNAPDVVRNAYLRRKPYTRETAQSRVDAAIQEQEPVISQLRDGVDAMSESPFTVIRAYPSGDLMGGIDVYPSDDHLLPEASDQRSEYSWVNQTWDIGYNLRPVYTGKGNMKATVKALIEGYVVPVMRIKRLGAEVRHDHAASLAILHGFEEVYRFEQDTAPESGVRPFTSIKLQSLFLDQE
ncbi:hypothetical protein BCR39DRAFT_287723 [Naematelia encephala]|uniref:N-acetyltransferase domain-containing protein n=1 Tax=Naematelia encephala TaxID=71784 RepID=A0A1Y2ASC4_9TREE|nr:hypothetical protein BCR39DRAFT_287723 [Naematelia encephala]